MISNAPERQRRILQMLESREFVRNAELRGMFNVTAMTLWRDLSSLEEKGLIRRSHGRIALVDNRVIEPDFRSKTDKAHFAKQRIAAYAVKHFIHEGDSLAMDGGTTVAAIADQMLPANLTILTNSLFTAERCLRHAARPAVYACGGLLREQSGTFIGREALTFFRRRHAQRYFLSATGIDIMAGVTDLTLEDNEVKQAMAASSKQIILLADRSKVGKVSLMQVLPWSKIHHFITDMRRADMKQICRVYPHLKIHRV